MNKKNERHRKIRNFLRFQTSPISVSEIHESMSRRMGLEISRKTIERDLLEMESLGEVKATSANPARYGLLGPSEIEISLKVDELRGLIQLLDPKSDLALKLKGYLGQQF